MSKEIGSPRGLGSDDELITKIRMQLEHLENILPSFRRRVADTRLPTAQEISSLIEMAYWASLRSNEGRATRTRISLLDPRYLPNSMSFSVSVPYDDDHISKLAPAVPSGGCIGVYQTELGCQIWGIAKQDVRGHEPISIEILDPGVLRIDLAMFRPFAVINKKSQVAIAATSNDLAHILQKILRKRPVSESPDGFNAAWRECLAFEHLARAILDIGHGGTVLIVPDENGSWKKSLDPFPYEFAAPDRSVHDIIRAELAGSVEQGTLFQELTERHLPDELIGRLSTLLSPQWGALFGTTRALASLSGVDGALIVTQDMRLLGFGAKIAIGGSSLSEVCTFRLGADNDGLKRVPLESLGGTRHQSAARFVAENKDTVAIVISQDRHSSILCWGGEPLNAVVVYKDAEFLT